MATGISTALRQVLSILGWPIRQLLLLSLRGYRRWISPALPASCKYYPSCSQYAEQSLRRHGALKGSLLAAARLVRCNPFSEGGLNPIPESGHWRASVGTDGSPRTTGSDAGKTLGSDSNGDPAIERSSTSRDTEPTEFLATGV